MDPVQQTEEQSKTAGDDTAIQQGDDGASKAVEDKEKKALYDQPLVLEGKRKRKSTELFSFSDKEKLQKTQEYGGGEGTRLGDIPFIEHNIAKIKIDQLKVLFRLCYDRPGSKGEIKRSLRDFSGFTDKELVEKKRVTLQKMLVPGLKQISDWLGLETSGKKEDIVSRIIEFLNKPVDLGKVPKKRRRSSSAGSGKQRKKSKVSESDSEKVEDMEDDAIEEEEEEEEEKCQEGDNSMDTSQISTKEDNDEEPKEKSIQEDVEKTEAEKVEESKQQETKDAPSNVTEDSSSERVNDDSTDSQKEATTSGEQESKPNGESSSTSKDVSTSDKPSREDPPTTQDEPASTSGNKEE